MCRFGGLPTHLEEPMNQLAEIYSRDREQAEQQGRPYDLEAFRETLRQAGAPENVVNKARSFSYGGKVKFSCLNWQEEDA
jgi:stringent starvation protein B